MIDLTLAPEFKAKIPGVAVRWITASVRNSEHDESLWQERMPGNTFHDALKLHQQGRITEAEEIYHRVLQHQPDHPDTLHLLGVVRQQQGRHEEALELIGRAIQLRPDAATYHSNYGAALVSLRRFAEAVASFNRALAIRPNYADARANLGMAQAALNATFLRAGGKTGLESGGPLSKGQPSRSILLAKAQSRKGAKKIGKAKALL